MRIAGMAVKENRTGARLPSAAEAAEAAEPAGRAGRD